MVSSSPRFRFSKSFPREFMQWIPLLPKGGVFIQVEIYGQPPIPLDQNRGFHLGSFSTMFWVLNLWGHFEILNNVFWACHNHTIRFSQNVMEKICIPWIYLSNELSLALNRYRMQKLRPWEVDIPTYPIGAQMIFGVSPSGVRVLDFLHVKKASRASL
jgi:hypothetical protein